MGHAFWSGHAFGRDVFGREMCLVGTCVWSGHAFWSGNVFGRDMLLVDPNPECHTGCLVVKCVWSGNAFCREMRLVDQNPKSECHPT